MILRHLSLDVYYYFLHWNCISFKKKLKYTCNKYTNKNVNIGKPRNIREKIQCITTYRKFKKICQYVNMYAELHFKILIMEDDKLLYYGHSSSPLIWGPYHEQVDGHAPLSWTEVQSTHGFWGFSLPPQLFYETNRIWTDMPCCSSHFMLESHFFSM